MAVIHGNEEGARLFWKQGAKLNTCNVHNDNLLHAAVHGNLPTLLEDILPYFTAEQLAHRNSAGQTPLQLAIDIGNIRCERVLNTKLL